MTVTATEEEQLISLRLVSCSTESLVMRDISSCACEPGEPRKPPVASTMTGHGVEGKNIQVVGRAFCKRPATHRRAEQGDLATGCRGRMKRLQKASLAVQQFLQAEGGGQKKLAFAGWREEVDASGSTQHTASLLHLGPADLGNLGDPSLLGTQDVPMPAHGRPCYE